VWRRHAWAGSVGRAFLSDGLVGAGFAAVHDRHLAFARNALGAAVPAPDTGGRLSVVVGRRRQAGHDGLPPQAFPIDGPPDRTDYLHGAPTAAADDHDGPHLAMQADTAAPHSVPAVARGAERIDAANPPVVARAPGAAAVVPLVERASPQAAGAPRSARASQASVAAPAHASPSGDLIAPRLQARPAAAEAIKRSVDSTHTGSDAHAADSDDAGAGAVRVAAASVVDAGTDAGAAVMAAPLAIAQPTRVARSSAPTLEAGSVTPVGPADSPGSFAPDAVRHTQGDAALTVAGTRAVRQPDGGPAAEGDTAARAVSAAGSASPPDARGESRALSPPAWADAAPSADRLAHAAHAAPWTPWTPSTPSTPSTPLTPLNPLAPLARMANAGRTAMVEPGTLGTLGSPATPAARIAQGAQATLSSVDLATAASTDRQTTNASVLSTAPALPATTATVSSHAIAGSQPGLSAGLVPWPMAAARAPAPYGTTPLQPGAPVKPSIAGPATASGALTSAAFRSVGAVELPLVSAQVRGAVLARQHHSASSSPVAWRQPAVLQADHAEHGGPAAASAPLLPLAVTAPHGSGLAKAMSTETVTVTVTATGNATGTPTATGIAKATSETPQVAHAPPSPGAAWTAHDPPMAVTPMIVRVADAAPTDANSTWPLRAIARAIRSGSTPSAGAPAGFNAASVAVHRSPTVDHQSPALPDGPQLFGPPSSFGPLARASAGKAPLGTDAHAGAFIDTHIGRHTGRYVAAHNQSHSDSGIHTDTLADTLTHAHAPTPGVAPVIPPVSLPLTRGAATAGVSLAVARAVPGTVFQAPGPAPRHGAANASPAAAPASPSLLVARASAQSAVPVALSLATVATAGSRAARQGPQDAGARSTAPSLPPSPLLDATPPLPQPGLAVLPAAPAAVSAAADVDELVERALQALMLRLDIESERRGYTRWA